MLIYDTICSNNAYTEHGFNISANELQTTGTFEYQYNILNPVGCDTIIKLNLYVVIKDTTILNATICEGDTYSQNGFNESKSGIYEQYLQNRFGCDSIVILELYVAKPSDTVYLLASICEGEAYSKNGFNASKTGTYIRNLQNYAGCDSVVVLDLTVNQNPDIKIIAITDNFCGDDFILLEIITNGDNFQWSTGSLENIITITEAGTYTATAFLGDCQKTAEYTVEHCPCEVWLPNFFSPNGDELNDVFIPVVHSVLTSFSMHIYDRWGQIVYKTDTYTPWDGTSKGRQASAGVYFCVITYSCAHNPTITLTKHGSITLVR